MKKHDQPEDIDIEKEKPATAFSAPVVLTSKQEVADELKMSLYQFEQIERKYPFAASGAPGKIMGRWRITREDAWNWFRYVQRQELRHPDARRYRPEEPPVISDIRGR